MTPREDPHQHLGRAMSLLQLQQSLVDELVVELGTLRAERDEARQMRGLIQQVLAKLAGTSLPGQEPRVCSKCPTVFTPPAHRHLKVCPACRRRQAATAAAARRAGLVRTAS